jgi:rhamnosyltransferase
MEMDGVSVVVVTFHPDSEVLINLTAVRPEVEHLIVVDNGSTAQELAPLRVASQSMNFELIENGENLGIASALNIGIRRAMQLNAFYIFLFDQDSRVTDGFVATMIATFRGSRWGAELGILVPQYTDIRHGTPLFSNRVRHGLEAAMTSGSLLRAETFTRCGYFVDDLFIDGVDYEFSLRLRKIGYVIDECSEAMLLHSPGEPRHHKLFGVFRYKTANYSPVRRYYQERNKVWITKRYGLRFPVFCFKLFLFSSKDFVKILVAEEDKLIKARYFLRGVLDGIRGRLGKLAGT